MSSLIKHSFSFPIRVYVEDTDAGGIVFYANYLKFMERARTEFMRSLGFEQALGFEKNRLNENNTQFVVHSANMQFLQAARMDMLLSVSVELQKLAKSYFVVHQKVSSNQNNIVYCQAEIKIACVNNENFKPSAMPAFVYSALKTCL